MLITTLELIECLQTDKSSRNRALINPLVHSVLKCGTKSDAEAILQQFLANSGDFDHYFYLPDIFRKYGDETFAEQIFKVCVKDGKLTDENCSEVLELLGDLKYLPAKNVLIEYAIANHEQNYYSPKHAILGLLNFDCEDLESIIIREIEKVYGKNLFSEFIPALVCKLKNRSAILEKLYETGCQYASTDCNAGIVLAFSLCGEEGRGYFNKIVFDKHWELYSFSTGTGYFAYRGMNELGITFQELHRKILLLRDTPELNYALKVLFSMLECRLRDRYIKNNNLESFSEIYQSLFAWTSENKNDIISALAQQAEQREIAYRLERMLELKVNEEVVLKNFGS